MSAKKVFNADEVAASILKSPKYRAIAPDAVNRIAAEECKKGGADCEKRAQPAAPDCRRVHEPEGAVHAVGHA